MLDCSSLLVFSVSVSGPLLFSYVYDWHEHKRQTRNQAVASSSPFVAATPCRSRWYRKNWRTVWCGVDVIGSSATFREGPGCGDGGSISTPGMQSKELMAVSCWEDPGSVAVEKTLSVDGGGWSSNDASDLARTSLALGMSLGVWRRLNFSLQIDAIFSNSSGFFSFLNLFELLSIQVLRYPGNVHDVVRNGLSQFFLFLL